MSGNTFDEKLARRQEIIKNIEFLRCKLVYLVKTKATLEDPEILAVSQELDLLLDEYYLDELSLKPRAIG